MKKPPITNALRPPLPPALFHYTTAGGLKGIIESGELWASNARYLNDSQEITYGIKRVKEVLLEPRQLGVAGRLLRDRIQSAITILDTVADRIYAICFCESDDLLSQWRGYANMGGGYCIGFRPDLLEIDMSPDLKPVLRKVLYTENEQKNTIRTILDTAYQWVDALKQRQRKNGVDAAEGDLLIEFFGLVSAIKGPSFHAEDEWRLVYAPDMKWLGNNLKFIDSGAWLKPYFIATPREKKVNTLPVVSVTCGPSLNPDLSVEAVKLFLHRNGYWNVITSSGTQQAITVAASTVPFRFNR